MMKIRPLRATFLLAIVPILFFASSCGSTTETVGVTYKPPFVPVIFAINSKGTISIQGNYSIVTPVGTFGLEANVSDTLQPIDNALLLVIRHQQNGGVVDDEYKIQTGQDEVRIVTNGTTTIDVTLHKMFIDASKGAINSIEVKDANSQSTATSSTPIPTLSPIPSPTPIPTATPTPILTVSSQFHGTIVGDQNSTTYQVTLEITKTYAGGRFEGKWFAVINNVREAVFVQGVGVPFDESSRFSQVNQDKAQQVQQQFSGSGTLLWFTSTSYAIGQDIWLGCEYYGLLQTDGSVQGLWYPPGSNSDGGTFQLA